MLRNKGEWRGWQSNIPEFTGSLSCIRASNGSNMVKLFIPDGPDLYDPKFKSVFENEMRIVGMERDEAAWVLQEWECVILSA